MAAWKSVMPLVAIAVLIIYEEMVTSPSCATVPRSTDIDESGKEDPEDLKVMMVANMLLLGSEAGYFNIYFRDYYMSKFFRKSFGRLKPDMLLVLGDISAKGHELTKIKWLSVVRQFERMLGPFLGLPFHVILGDRDVGECSRLDATSVYWIASNFPGLDPAGCGAFEISNISFVSLNAVALLCGKNDLRFSVEKVIERESVDLRMENEGKTVAITNGSSMLRETSPDYGWRENAMSSGSGPVLLLHFPLHRTANGKCEWSRALEQTSNASKTLKSRGLAGSGLYERLQSLPPNATEYIFQALRPRIVFSAHTHEFCDYTHSDGTREVTVPAMTWNTRDDPGFVVATFRKNRGVVSVSHCFLARESHVLVAHVCLLVLLVLMMLAASTLRLTSLRR